MKNGGWLDSYDVPQAQNGIEGTMAGLTDKGFNYNGAWGGQFQTGGSLPGSVGFTYARTKGIPSEGPYAKKTMPSAQNGQEMRYYQNGLDWKPKTISRDGAWLDGYEKAQKGKKVKIKDERLESITEPDNFSKKENKDLTLNQLMLERKDRQEFEKKGTLKNPRSLAYKNKVKELQSRMTTVSQDKLTPQQRREYSDAMDKVQNEPLKAGDMPLIYLADPDKIIGDLGVKGFNTSEEDRQKINLNRYNPAQSGYEKFKNNLEMGIGYVPEASLNLAMGAAFAPQSAGVRGILNETLNPLAGSSDNLIRLKSAANRFINNRLTTRSAIHDAVRITDDAILGSAKDESKDVISNQVFNPEINWGNWNKEISKKNLSEGNNIRYIFTDVQGNNIGTFSGKKSPEGIYVNSIEVNPEFRRQGVASNIYKNIAKELQSKNEGTLFSRSGQHQFTDKDELGRSIAPANKLWEDLVNKGEAEKFVEGMSHTYKIKPLKQGGIIKDDRGQWDHPGEITEINSPYITMEGVPYPVLGISDTGDTKLMKPGKNYKFKGKKVTEFPMAKNGLRQEQKGLVNLDDLTNFTNYNKSQPGGWLSKYE
jgi:predicted GNAT family acetyltransferase